MMGSVSKEDVSTTRMDDFHESKFSFEHVQRKRSFSIFCLIAVNCLMLTGLMKMVSGAPLEQVETIEFAEGPTSSPGFEMSSINPIETSPTTPTTSTEASSAIPERQDVSTQTMNSNTTNSIENKLSEKKEEIAASFASLENKTIDGVENIMEKVEEMGPMIDAFQQEMSDRIDIILDTHEKEYRDSIKQIKENSRRRLNPLIAGSKVPRKFGRMKRDHKSF
ncbi:uncharacterized protein LOC141850013 [Brevipalpus obovatus]|uniref:uncharacterized protein LOC141850013 n=1 Tax=Brevipalpus obovatus TaxID=246614 RepID=UPI003D9F1E92